MGKGIGVHHSVEWTPSFLTHCKKISPNVTIFWQQLDCFVAKIAQKPSFSQRFRKICFITEMFQFRGLRNQLVFLNA